MESIANIERDCNAISNLFQVIVNDMKGSSGNWEDLVIKATKFHTQLKATITASTAFLDAFQRIADLATSTRGQYCFFPYIRVSSFLPLIITLSTHSAFPIWTVRHFSWTVLLLSFVKREKESSFFRDQVSLDVKQTFPSLPSVF